MNNNQYDSGQGNGGGGRQRLNPNPLQRPQSSAPSNPHLAPSGFGSHPSAMPETNPTSSKTPDQIQGYGGGGGGGTESRHPLGSLNSTAPGPPPSAAFPANNLLASLFNNSSRTQGQTSLPNAFMVSQQQQSRGSIGHLQQFGSIQQLLANLQHQHEQRQQLGGGGGNRPASQPIPPTLHMNAAALLGPLLGQFGGPLSSGALLGSSSLNTAGGARDDDSSTSVPRGEQGRAAGTMGESQRTSSGSQDQLLEELFRLQQNLGRQNQQEPGGSNLAASTLLSLFAAGRVGAATGAGGGGGASASPLVAGGNTSEHDARTTASSSIDNTTQHRSNVTSTGRGGHNQGDPETEEELPTSGQSNAATASSIETASSSAEGGEKRSNTVSNSISRSSAGIVYGTSQAATGGGSGRRDNEPNNILASTAGNNSTTGAPPSSVSGPLYKNVLPCRARGMPMDHNFKNAYFVVTQDTKHGDQLICSFPQCRNGGVKFRYCVVCRMPVAQRNFHKRHAHEDALEQPPGQIAPPQQQWSQTPPPLQRRKKTPASSRAESPALSTAALASIPPLPKHTSSTRSSSSALLGAASSSGADAEATRQVLISHVLKSFNASTPGASSSAPANDPPVSSKKKSMKRHRRYRESVEEEEPEMRKRRRKHRSPGSSLDKHAERGSSLPHFYAQEETLDQDRRRAWTLLLLNRPEPDDDMGISAWLMRVMAVSDKSKPINLASIEAAYPTTSEDLVLSAAAFAARSSEKKASRRAEKKRSSSTSTTSSGKKKQRRHRTKDDAGAKKEKRKKEKEDITPPPFADTSDKDHGGVLEESSLSDSSPAADEDATLGGKGDDRNEGAKTVGGDKALVLARAAAPQEGKRAVILDPKLVAASSKLLGASGGGVLVGTVGRPESTKQTKENGADHHGAKMPAKSKKKKTSYPSTGRFGKAGALNSSTDTSSHSSADTTSSSSPVVSVGELRRKNLVLAGTNARTILSKADRGGPGQLLVVNKPKTTVAEVPQPLHLVVASIPPSLQGGGGVTSSAGGTPGIQQPPDLSFLLGAKTTADGGKSRDENDKIQGLKTIEQRRLDLLAQDKSAAAVGVPPPVEQAEAGQPNGPGIIAAGADKTTANLETTGQRATKGGGEQDATTSKSYQQPHHDHPVPPGATTVSSSTTSIMTNRGAGGAGDSALSEDDTTPASTHEKQEQQQQQQGSSSKGEEASPVIYEL